MSHAARPVIMSLQQHSALSWLFIMHTTLQMLICVLVVEWSLVYLRYTQVVSGTWCLIAAVMMLIVSCTPPNHSALPPSPFLVLKQNDGSNDGIAREACASDGVLLPQAHVQQEKEIQAECSSCFMVNLVASYKDSAYLYMLLECVMGGELFTYLQVCTSPPHGLYQLINVTLVSNAACPVMLLGHNVNLCCSHLLTLVVSVLPNPNKVPDSIHHWCCLCITQNIQFLWNPQTTPVHVSVFKFACKLYRHSARQPPH